MGYCSIDDIKDRMPEALLIQLTDDTGSGVVNATRVSKAIEDADSLIDAYLYERYALPLTIESGIIKKISIDISLYLIYTGRYDNNVPKDIRLRFVEALEFLQKLQEGRVSIKELDGDDQKVKSILTSKTAEDRIFGNEDLDKY